MSAAGLHVVVGAGGATGRRVVGELSRAGHPVRAITRDGRQVGPPGVAPVAADATDPTALRAACRGADTVYHCAMPPIGDRALRFPPMTDAIVDAAAAAATFGLASTPYAVGVAATMAGNAGEMTTAGAGRDENPRHVHLTR